MKRLLLALALVPCAWSARAASLELDIEIPSLEVAEYHRPYVAIWIEREDASVAANLAAWYLLDKPKNNGESGTKWLPDLRQWWRRSGRSLSLPVDGVTGATRPPGVHSLRFDDARALKDLAPGQYRVVIEAAREVGGREWLKLPLTWPPSEAGQAEVKGENELGRIVLRHMP